MPLKRILILDFDVHHGNGTQDIFYTDNSVFYCSIHQKGIYPQSGHAHETGEGIGKGFTLNVELEKGQGNKEALEAIHSKLAPAMEKFKPEFVLVSAGFDGHIDDPLGGLTYTQEGYKHIAEQLIHISKRYADGKIVFMLEGGYGLRGLSDSVVEILSIPYQAGN